MTLPASGTLSATQIIVEEGIKIADSFDMNSARSRALAGKPSGQIAYSDFYGKTYVVPGCLDVTTSQSVVIPAFLHQLIVQVWGAGGGGGPNPEAGTASTGGASIFFGPTNLTGNGGGGGTNQFFDGGSIGIGGTATGGQQNFPGQDGQGNNGGSATNGGAGGQGGLTNGNYVRNHGPQNSTHINAGYAGGFPGGGGGGEASMPGTGPTPGGNIDGGGAGGYCYRIYGPKDIIQGNGYYCQVGEGGSSNGLGGKGGDGLIRLCWDTPVTLPQNNYPANGTLLGHFCSGTTLYNTYADGVGGSYNQVAEVNSISCGYVAPLPRYTFAVFAQQYGYSLTLVQALARYYNTTDLHSYTVTEPSVVSGQPDVTTTIYFYSLNRKPDVGGLAYWVGQYQTDPINFDSKFWGGIGTTDNIYNDYSHSKQPGAFQGNNTLGDFIDPPAGYS